MLLEGAPVALVELGERHLDTADKLAAYAARLNLGRQVWLQADPHGERRLGGQRHVGGGLQALLVAEDEDLLRQVGRDAQVARLSLRVGDAKRQLAHVPARRGATAGARRRRERRRRRRSGRWGRAAVGGADVAESEAEHMLGGVALEVGEPELLRVHAARADVQQQVLRAACATQVAHDHNVPLAARLRRHAAHLDHARAPRRDEAVAGVQ